MPVTVETPQQIAHPNFLGGDQGNGKVGVFADGSFVVAWTSGFFTDLRKYAADGTVIASTTVLTNGRLEDMAVTGDGWINLLWADSFGVVFESFDGQTYAKIGTQLIGPGFLSPNNYTAQMIARDATTLDIVLTDGANNARIGVNSSAQVVTPFFIPSLSGGAIIEAVAGGLPA